MFWTAFVSILALPTAFGGLVEKDDACGPINATPLHYWFSYTGKPHSSLPKAPLTTDAKCNGDPIDLHGKIMADSTCNAISSAKSIKPGPKEDADGNYCLLKSREKDCGCIAQVEDYTFESGKEAPCITMEDSDWQSYKWIRKCDAAVSDPL